MSCSIKQIGAIKDIDSVRNFLFSTDTSSGDKWLQLCEISFSPTGETVVLGRNSRLVVASASWDSNDSILHFQIDFSDYITQEDDVIKSVLCLPVVGSSQHSKVCPEWNCIVIGFESGFVRFYTETCQLLYEEQYHNASVCSVKCQSQHSPRPDITLDHKPEELYIHYPSNVCILNGPNLFTLLRNKRNQLHTLSKKLEESTLGSTNIRKWGYQDQFSIKDSIVVGLDLTNTFDHLLTASICGGFDTKYRAMPPNNSLVISAGSSPFIGFHYALEGGAQPALSDVTQAVATRLISALPDWLRSSSQEKRMIATTPADTMGCRFGICDSQRTSNSVCLSPDKRLAVITDTLGRVSVVDTHRGVVIRMLKGYREAQCAFVQVPDERHSKYRSRNRIALFLIIYSSKKGTIEIFSAPICLRIVTFSASKFSRLLYVNYGLFGFTSTKKSKFSCSFTCVLMEVDGTIKDFLIPFHFSLTEKNSKRVRDLHLYKRLKAFIKTEDYTSESLINECVNTCKELKTSEICLQTIEMMIACKQMNVETVLESTKYFIDKFNEIDKSELDNYAEILIILSENLQILSNFFLFLIKDEENGNCEEENTNMRLGNEELKQLQQLLDLSTDDNENTVKVCFQEEELKLSDYFATFDLLNTEITLKGNIDPLTLLNVSSFVFKSYINGSRTDFLQLQNELAKIKLTKSNLFEMVLNYWVIGPLSINSKLESEMDRLNKLIYSLANDITVEYNQISTFWENIREKLANSPRPFPALTAALICRSVAQRIEGEKEQQSDGSIAEDGFEIWEKMSQENCKWSLLIGKLEDISLLNIILLKKPICLNSEIYNLPKLKHEPIDISLKLVLEKGKGIISELVARWLTTLGINPIYLINEETNECYNQYLLILRKQFPHSLTSDILLANACWEYALYWKNDPQDFTCLQAALNCLNNIINPHFRQGLSNLFWNTHLKIIFESCAKLINKVGKLPKEKLCKQDTGFTDFQIKIFIEICTQFLDQLMDTVEMSYNSDKFTLKYENIWENGNGHSLSDLIMQHDYINYDLLHAHFQLSLTLQMIITFNIKHTKPINNLFDTMCITHLFSDLKQHTQINWHTSDSKIKESRMQLLFKVVSASVETITIDNGEVYTTDHVKWMGKIINLAPVWNLEFDLLRQHQIIQLFTHGFDAIAQELLPTVTNTSQLGPDLLTICGKRLKIYIASSEHLGEVVSTISPTIMQFIDKMDDKWCAPTDLQSIYSLTTHSLACLNEDDYQFKIAAQLLDALEHLIR